MLGNIRQIALAVVVAMVPLAPTYGGETPHAGEWGYRGATGPEHWAELADDYRICAMGQQESPIDLRDPIAAQLGRLDFDDRAVPLKALDSGHAVQVEMAGGGALRMGGKSYELVQMHLHHPSEHLLAGRRFPLEAHFVHRRADGVLGVVAVFFEQGAANPALTRVIGALARDGQRARASETVRVSDFLPPAARRSFLRYEGSLTTPPCDENVDWVVLDTPRTASADQIAAVERVHAFNARPVQKINRRFLLRSN